MWEAGSEPIRDPAAGRASPRRPANGSPISPPIPKTNTAARGHTAAARHVRPAPHQGHRRCLSAKGLEKAPLLAARSPSADTNARPHGITHTQQFHLSREAERPFIVDGLELIERLTGQRSGRLQHRRAVWRSANTLSLAAGAGLPLSHRRLQPRRAVHRAGRRQAVRGGGLFALPQRLLHLCCNRGDLAGYERTLNEDSRRFMKRRKPAAA